MVVSSREPASVRGRRGRARLHEKDGKGRVVRCHHTLEKLVDDYLAAARIAYDLDGLLFRTTGRKTGAAHALWQRCCTASKPGLIQSRCREKDAKARNPCRQHACVAMGALCAFGTFGPAHSGLDSVQLQGFTGPRCSRGKSPGELYNVRPRCASCSDNVGGFLPFRRGAPGHAAPACPGFCPSYVSLGPARTEIEGDPSKQQRDIGRAACCRRMRPLPAPLK